MKNKELTVLYFNARSIRNKISDLDTALNTGKYDFVFISETWLNETNLSSSIINTVHYGIVRNDRRTHAGGVAAIYQAKYADKIVVHTVDPNELCGFELLAFDLYVNSRYSVCFICVYLSPHESKNPSTVISLLRVLKRFMAKKEVYVIGDFNFSDYKPKNNYSKGKESLQHFLCFLEEQCLSQLVTQPTHNSGNILDLVITSKPQNIIDIQILNPFTDTCDHNTIELKLNINTTTSSNRTPKHNFYKGNYNNINQYLSSINWENVLAPHSNINQMYTNFIQILHTTISLFVPISKNTKKPRLPKHIKLILNRKQKLYKKSKIDSSFKSAYKAQEKLYKKAVKEYRYKCEKNVLKSKNKKVLFNHIKGKLSTRHHIPPLQNSNNEIFLESQSKANLLNQTFAKVFLQENTPTQFPALDTSYNHIECSKMPVISHQDIYQTILRMKSSVSRTPDAIPTYYLQHTASQLIEPLYILFNFSVCTGQVPDIWKQALVTPIYKKGSSNDPKNYRPISLTSSICRVLERIIHSHISSHLLNNNIISPEQHGFVKDRSTQTQQIAYLDQLTSLFDQRIQLEAVYLDFSKAFDKVSHFKLVHILGQIKIHHKLITWIHNYLIGRSQITIVDSSHSDSIPVTSGVPQGSVLGPLLFIIYLQDLINTIKSNCSYTNIYVFADDIKLVSTDAKDLQKSLNIVNDWIKKWKLLLNADKSEHVTLRQDTSKTLFIGNQSIPKVNYVKDLGVILSNDIKWNAHIGKIRSKANILSHTILRTFKTNDTSLLTNLFKTYVRPVMEYNTCTWSPYLKGDIQNAESVQRMYTKRLCQRANISFIDYNDRLNKLGLESLQARRIKNDLILIYKIMNNLIGIDHTHHFTFTTFGGHNLRRHSLHITQTNKTNTLTRQNFFSHRVIKHWNSLPESTVTSPTLAIFKTKLKSLEVELAT